MSRILFLSTLLLSSLLYSQSYVGFEADNFNGIHGVLSNRAHLANSRAKLDINKFSISSYNTDTYSQV